MSVVRAFWSRLFRPLKILFWVIVGIVVLALILYGCMIVGNWMAVTAEAADLKCVTIKFKNDSELKLKTQWFVNAPTIKIKCRWLAVPTDGYGATAAFYKEMGRQIRESPEYKEFGYFELYSCDTLLLDRTLLFPPDVRREPVIKDVPIEEVTQLSDTEGFSISAIDIVGWECDTIPGEALLWYKEKTP